MSELVSTAETWCTGSAPSVEGASVQNHFDAATTLARRAFVDRDEEALATLHRTQYLLNIHSSFASPTDLVPAVYWNVFSAALMEDALRGCPDEVDPTELEERMMKAVVELGAYNHPLVQMMDQRAEVFRHWSKNWYASTHGYTFQMTSIAQRLAPESDISVYTPTVFRNLSDELADEFSKTPHHRLRYRILEGVGCSYDVWTGARDPDIVTEAFALLNLRTAMASQPSAYWALGSVYGVEANWVLETPKLARLLGRAGYDTTMYESYELHAKLDVEHAGEWLEMVCEIPMSPQEAARVVAGATAGLKVRRDMYDRLLAQHSED